MKQLEQKIDAIHVPAGYAVASGLGSTPLWVDNITTWLELLALVLAVAVGATTAWLNIVKIKKVSKIGVDGKIKLDTIEDNGLDTKPKK